jgi:hypothetical protein
VIKDKGFASSPPNSAVAVNAEEMIIFGGSTNQVYTYSTKSGDATGLKVS